MTIKIGINGFGRIGRCIVRAGIDRDDIQFVGINDLTNAENLAYMLKYDSVHKRFEGEVKTEGNALVVNGKRIPVIAERDPAKLPWKSLGAEVVHECTGRFVKKDDAGKHLEAGARWVIISAPAKGDVKTIAYGVNHKTLDLAKDQVLSNASCTTNCLAPLAKVLNDSFGIVSGLMTTIHSYTNNQALLDTPSADDWRRGRAAAISMVPTTTGAAKAVGLVLPELKGRLDGFSVRVPTPNVSLVDLTARLSREVTREEIDQAMGRAAEGEMRGVLEISKDPTVSVDIIGNPHSAVYLPELTYVQGDLVKVLAWYDNEWGFSQRMLDVSAYIDSQR